MPRLSQIPRADAEAPIVLSMYNRLFGDRDPVAEPGTATGTPGDWWAVFANSPDGFSEIAAPDDYVPENLGRQIAYDTDDGG